MKNRKLKLWLAAAALIATTAPWRSAAWATPRTDEALAWWKDFGDPQLAELVEEAIGGNRDLQAAWERTREAEASARRARAALLPSARFEAGVNAAPTDSLGFQFGGLPLSRPGDDDPPEVYYSGSAQVNLGIDTDLFGRGYLSYRATRYDLAASRGDRDAQALALSSRVAEAYYDAVAASMRLAMLEDQRTTNEALLELLELRYHRGEGSALAVLQQRQQVAATTALEPQARAVNRVARQILATLMGRSTEAAPLFETRVLPAATPDSLPDASDFTIAERPDLRAATSRVRAAKARATSAVRGLLPSVRLSGQGGLQANHFTELVGQSFWGAGMSVSLPIFEGGRNYAEIDRAAAGFRASQNSRDQLELQARQEIESARVRAEEQLEQHRALARQEAAARVVFEEARARYLAGLDSYLDVLNALGILQQVELSLLQTQRDLISTRIQLFTAGGGRPTGPAAPRGTGRQS